MHHNNNYAIACLSHDKSKTCNLIGLREFKTADSAHTRNRAIVTRPFSLAEGWGLETRLVKNDNIPGPEAGIWESQSDRSICN